MANLKQGRAGSAVAARSHRLQDGEVERAVRWYFDNVFGVTEGPGTIPFYCDPKKIGGFAVGRDELAAGSDVALFRLFVAFAMFQGLRDVVVMRHQRSLAPSAVATIASLDSMQGASERNDCPMLASASTFHEGCDVAKQHRKVDCAHRPQVACHVKDATASFKRMGDMGKLPTSAWLQHWKDGGLEKLLSSVCEREPRPSVRASLLVEEFARIHRVGRKLATMFVSALSTPALAPALSPWAPRIDGNELVVVDTNVARAADALRQSGALRTYDAREQWVREQAAQLDLRRFHPAAPAYSPRLLQQALYAYCSKSNRAANDDPCAEREGACARCAHSLCPFPAKA